MKKLDLMELTAACPGMVALAPSEHVSTKYRFVDSFRIFNWLYELGFYAFQVQNTNVRKAERRNVAKHAVFFTCDEWVGQDYSPCIIVVNAHDATSSVQFHVAVIVYACGNGLVAGTSLVEPIRIRHVGACYDDVRRAMHTMGSKIPEIIASIESMKSRELTDADAYNFAIKASRMRWPEKLPQKFSTSSLLRVRRYGDRGNSVWQIYNRVQENLVTGGRGFGYRRLTRIDRSIGLNQKLWDEAMQLTA